MNNSRTVGRVTSRPVPEKDKLDTFIEKYVYLILVAILGLTFGLAILNHLIGGN